jgi:hypothetical protein
LITEWLSSQKKQASDGDVEKGGSFEELPIARKMEARADWEKVVFEPAEINIDGQMQYLQTLFQSSTEDTGSPNQNKKVAKPIKARKEKVSNFETNMSASAQLNVHTLCWIIQGLQSSDLLTIEKREVLKKFSVNDVILGKIADVLNMRMESLSRWTWGYHVPLEQRRMLNGSYTVHMHDTFYRPCFSITSASSGLSSSSPNFLDFRRDKKAWKPDRADMPKTDRLRRENYLGKQSSSPNLQSKREKTDRKTYYMHQLLDHQTQQIVIQEGEEEAEFGEFAQDEEYEEVSRPPKRT